MFGPTRTLPVFTLCMVVHAACGEAPPGSRLVRDGNRWTLEVSRDLQPGEEQNDCLTAVVEEDLDVVAIRPATGGYQQTHHLILWRMDGVGREGARSCGDGVVQPGMGDGIYATGTVDAPLVFPDDTALFIPRGSRLTLNAHFLNASPEPVRATGRLDLELLSTGADPREPLHLWSVQNYSFHLPPRSSATTRQECTAPQDGTEGDWMDFDLAGGDAELRVLESPLAIHTGDVFVFSCEVDNDTDTLLTAPEEMCNAFIYVQGWEKTEVCVK